MTTPMAGPCACGRFQSFPASMPPLADGTMHVPVMPTPPLCEVTALGQERARLVAERDATVSCGHPGEDSACLECLACERYDRACSERRVKQLEAELAAAHHQLAEWREGVVAANRISQEMEARAIAAESEVAALRAEVERLNQEEFRRRTSGLSSDPVRIALAERSDRWQARALAAESALATARERGEALARALKRADDALTWALDKSPEACATMVKESAPFRCEARAALRAWEEGR